MAFREKTELDAWSLVPFASKAEETLAFLDKEYRNPANEAFRQAVYDKMALSTGGIHGKAYNDSKSYTPPTFVGNRNTEQGRSNAVEEKSDEQTMRELYGPYSVAMPKLIEPQATAPVNQWLRDGHLATVEIHPDK